MVKNIASLVLHNYIKLGTVNGNVFYEHTTLTE